MTERNHDFAENPELEAKLRSIRPKPDPDFKFDLERRLFLRPSRRQRLAWRPAFAAGLAATALAVLTIGFDLLGIGPFQGGGPVEAGTTCQTVVVTKRERQPVMRDGKVVLEYRAVRRHVKHCH